MMRRGLLALAAGIVVVGFVVWAARQWWWAEKAQSELRARVASVAAARPGAARPCQAAAGTNAHARLTLLVLGQSNAGNHAAVASSGRANAPQITVFADADCKRSGDPLPGATGSGRSIWSGLESELASRGKPVEIVAALLAVDSTSIADWTRANSPLAVVLAERLQAMEKAGFKPDLVLWQQGESDARGGTAAADYVAGFERLRSRLRSAGVTAPIVMARSTRCRNSSGVAVLAAQQELFRRHADLLPGPDTDALAGDLRDDDCHFSAKGVVAAAAAWADVLLRLKP